MRTITDMQAEIKALKAATVSVDKMLVELNADTDAVAEKAEDVKAKLKAQIIKDLEELKSYSDPDIYETCHLKFYDPDDVYGLYEGGKYAVIYPCISFNCKVYEFNKSSTVQADVAIQECCHTYAPFYKDGKFADDVKCHAVSNHDLEALYRHWPAILALAYEAMVKAYKDNASRKLKDAMDAKTKAYKRYADLQAAYTSALSEE